MISAMKVCSMESTGSAYSLLLSRFPFLPFILQNSFMISPLFQTTSKPILRTQSIPSTYVFSLIRHLKRIASILPRANVFLDNQSETIDCAF